jgi:predicted metal-dependent enzyme (double-stranded beta helix superfamily)
MTAISSPLALPVQELIALVRGIAADPVSWRTLLRTPDHGAQRWWLRLLADDQVDVWLLSWLPGQSTDLHDHAGSAAAFAVVSGVLGEVRVDAATGRRRNHLRQRGSITWLAPGMIHDVHGAGTGPAVSIHAYSPPLREMTYYADGPTGMRAVRTVRTDEPEQTGIAE